MSNEDGKDSFRISPPEFVGKIPLRADLEILPADTPRKEIGFTVTEYLGPELCKHFDENWQGIPLTTRDDLQPGDVVYGPYVTGGYVELTVHQDEDGELSAKTAGGTMACLTFDADDRHCWAVTAYINPRALKKLNVTSDSD